MERFDDIFYWPEELPPKRGIGHHIHLKKGTNNVNIRSYHYVYQQKEKMEKLECLLQGLFDRVLALTRVLFY